MKKNGYVNNSVGSMLNIYLDEPEQASLHIPEEKIDVDNSTSLTCDFGGDSSPGSPPASEFIFKNGSAWDSGPVPSPFMLTITSVLQESNYSCAGINDPTSREGKVEGQISTPKRLTVLGLKFMSYFLIFNELGSYILYKVNVLTRIGRHWYTHL